MRKEETVSLYTVTGSVFLKCLCSAWQWEQEGGEDGHSPLAWLQTQEAHVGSVDVSRLWLNQVVRNGRQKEANQLLVTGNENNHKKQADCKENAIFTQIIHHSKAMIL